MLCNLMESPQEKSLREQVAQPRGSSPGIVLALRKLGTFDAPMRGDDFRDSSGVVDEHDRVD